jgi:hypothetical protein
MDAWHPGQHEKPGIHGQQVPLPLPRRRTPANEAVAQAGRAGRRAPGEARDRAIARDDEILQMGADRLLVAEIVILRQTGC